MRILARTLGITALMMAPAFSALAQEPPPPAATEPPPATTPPPAATPMAPASTGGFGSVGQIVISADLPFTNESPQFAIVHRSVSDGGGSDTYFSLRPSGDYFVAPNISVGGQIGYTHGSTIAVGEDFNVFEIGVRGGYHLALNEMFSIWPHLGIEYAHISGTGYGGMSASGYAIPLIVTVPVLWHPAPHFFLGLAPTLTTMLVNKMESIDQPKETDIGISAVIGGYFGGV